MGERLINEYLKDVLRPIDEIVATKKKCKTLNTFRNTTHYLRTIEYDLLLIGELLKKIISSKPNLAEKIPGSEKIIALRNFLAHAYESIEPEETWKIATVELPTIKKQIKLLIKTK